MGGRNDRVVDVLPLRHVLEILFLEPERGILVQGEVDRLVVERLHALLEFEKPLRKRMGVIELHGADQRRHGLGPNDGGGGNSGSERTDALEQSSAFHRKSLSLDAPLMGAANSLSDKIWFDHHLERPIEMARSR